MLPSDKTPSAATMHTAYQAWYAVATVATKPTADRSYQPYSHRWVMFGCTQYAYGY